VIQRRARSTTFPPRFALLLDRGLLTVPLLPATPFSLFVAVITHPSSATSRQPRTETANRHGRLAFRSAWH